MKPGAPKRHKYAARPTVRDGQRFDSKLEATVYDRLCLLQKGGGVVFFLRQVPLHLEAGVKLVVDFLVFWSDGTCSFVDAKGVETESFRAKKRQAETRYPIEIEVWSK